MTGSTHGSARGGVVISLAICLASILIASPSAFGQAAAEQYVPRAGPEGTKPPEPGTEPATGTGSVSGAPPAEGKQVPTVKVGSTESQDLPLVNYPATSFTRLVVFLLIACALLAVGIVVARRMRLRAPRQ